MSIAETVESLIEQNATDFQFSKAFKKAIAEYQHSLPEMFGQNQGKDFLVRHTKTYDTFITQMYKSVLRRMFHTYLPMRSAIPVAFVALGSYGREQLCVHSDIDLMVVYEEVEGYQTTAIIEKFLYLAWDAGLKLGHRVHRVDELVDAANDDISIRTAMMESRFIVGSNFTWHATQRELHRMRHHAPTAYIRAKIEEAQARHKKYSVGMQPNIKEGVGGMRDAQLLFWVAKTRFGVDSPKDLSGKVYSEEAYRHYRMALELLYRVRSALHLAAGKQHDQLNLDYLPQVRKLLGYAGDMKLAEQVIAAMWTIHTFCDIYVTKLARPLLSDTSHVKALRQARIAPGFYLVDGTVYGRFDAPGNIEALLTFLVHLPDRPMQFDAGVVFRFRDVTLPQRFSTKVLKMLRQLFERRHAYDILELFYRSGLLAKLIPAFKKVLFLPQFDGYHHYPVGLHSLMCVKALESIREPRIAALYETLDFTQRSLLKIVVMMHDAGKGRKLDHSEVGIKLTVPLMKKLGFEEAAIATATVLVRHHILMSTVAQRQNIHSEKTLYKFMSAVQTPENLKLLYILTYADMSGVGPGIFNAFNAGLLHELYLASLEVAQESKQITDAAKRLRVERRIQRQPAYQVLPKTLQKKFFSIESNLFFYRHSPQELIEIVRWAREVRQYQYELRIDGSFSIEILRKVPLNLAYLLGKLGYLDIVSMEVFTLFDEVKYFKIDFLQTPSVDIFESLRATIEASFEMERTIVLQPVVIRPAEIKLDCDHSRDYSELAVHTANQRGLLAHIIHSLDELNLTITTAKIHSTKHRARDHFLIEKTDRMCDQAEQLIALLCAGSVIASGAK